MRFWNSFRRFFSGFAKATLAVGLAKGLLAAGSAVLTKGLSLLTPLVAFGRDFFASLFSSEGLFAGLSGGFHDAFARDEPTRRAMATSDTIERLVAKWNAREGAHGLIICESNVIPAPIYYSRRQLERTADVDILPASADWYHEFSARVPAAKLLSRSDIFVTRGDLLAKTGHHDGAHPLISQTPAIPAMGMPPTYTVPFSEDASSTQNAWEELVHGCLTFDPKAYVTRHG